MTENTTHSKVSQSHRVQRFQFASFDEKPQLAVLADSLPPALESQPEEAPAAFVPSITDEELAQAVSEARKAGHKEGMAEAREKQDKDALAHETAVQSLLEVIANRITLAAEEHAAHGRSREALIHKIILAIGRKLAGEALRREPYKNVEMLLGQCVALVTGSPKIQITVSPSRAEGLRQRLDTLRPLLAGFEGDMQVGEDALFGEQDCRVEWKNGYAERSETALWKEIELLIQQSVLM